jgi:hypothetical protein
VCFLPSIDSLQLAIQRFVDFLYVVCFIAHYVLSAPILDGYSGQHACSGSVLLRALVNVIVRLLDRIILVRCSVATR